MKTPLAKIGIVWMVLLLTLNQVKAEELTRIFHASQSAVWPKPMDTVLGSNSDRSGMYSYSSDQNSSPSLFHQLFSSPRCESYEISGLIPEELQWEYLGYTSADPTILAPSPTFNFTATGPYHAPANVVLVISMPHPEAISRVDFCNGDQSLLTLPNPILKEYELSLSNTLPAGHYVITANVYDLEGGRQTFATEFDVFPSNRYVRGVRQRPGNTATARQDYLSSLITLDQERGDFLDGISDFSLVYGSNYPWFLRINSEVNAPC